MPLDGPVNGDVATLVCGLVGPGIAVAAARTGDAASDLAADEAPAVAKAIDRRRGEFAAGRRAARTAMAALGLRPVAIPMNPDRSPAWPEGIVGSISHTGAHCVAAVARSGPVRALGVDLEPDEPLEEKLHRLICTPAELEMLSALAEERRGRLGRLIFSAKEALYKAQHPLTATLIGFDAVEIDPFAGEGRFTATFRTPVGEFAAGAVLHGRAGAAGGLLATAVVIPGRGSR